MLAAINTYSLDDFTIDKWLSNNVDDDNFSLLRTDLVLEGDEVLKNYRAFENDEPSLIEHLKYDLWNLLDTCYESSDTLDNEVFPFYIIDTDTKTVVNKIGLSFVHTIETKTLDQIRALNAPFSFTSKIHSWAKNFT